MSIPCPKCGRLYCWDGKRCCRQDCRYGSDLEPIKPDLRSTSFGTSAVFEYDPWRGGFCLAFGSFSREGQVRAFGRMLSVYPEEHGRIAAIESYWDHGGLPLRGIHKAEQYPEGEFSVEGRELRLGPLQLRQSAEKLEVWFSTGNDLPRDHWSSQHEAEWGITLWFSHRKAKAGWHDPGCSDAQKEWPLVAGLVLEFGRTITKYPITSVSLFPSDFKG